MTGDEDWIFSSLRIVPPRESKPAGSELQPGALLGGLYRIDELLGTGAMGAVYRAWDEAARREVAVKVVRERGLSPVNLERLRREGELIAALDHPHVLRIYSAGEAEGRPYLVYELVPGCRELAEVWRALPRARRLVLLLEVARGLAAAHERGIVHRDVKPGNVLVDAAGRARLADFGLATALGVGRLTTSGVMLGTPSHMSPEAIRGDRGAIGPASDVWALGVMLYWALSDRLPFPGPSLTELSAQILVEEVEPPGTPEAPAPLALRACCARALAKSPGDRPSDAGAFARELEAALQPGAAPPAPPRGAAGRATVLLLAGGALALAGGLALRPALAPEERAGPEQAPGLSLDTPRELEVYGAELSVAGVCSAPEVELTLGAQVWRVAGPRFALSVPLEPGENRIRVGAPGSPVEGRALVLALRRVPPPWFASYRHPPPWPLPAGLRCGERWRELENARDGSALVWVEPGELVLGPGEDGPGAPARRARLAGYFLGRHEVTRAQVDHALRAAGQPARYGERGNLPAADLSWAEAAAYCAWAGLRLPSADEWEYAARGPEGRRYPWGDAPPTRERGNFVGGHAAERGAALPVGSFPLGESACGCLDLEGNVSEWVADAAPAPAGAEPGRWRVVKGSSFVSSPIGKWNARRTGQAPEHQRKGTLGFRVCRSP